MTTKPPAPPFFLAVPITPPDTQALKPPAPRGPTPSDEINPRERAQRKLAEYPDAAPWVREIWEKVAKGEKP